MPTDGVCPVAVDRPLMSHSWDLLTFLHWRYEPSRVQALLPHGLEVETFDGSAWVGLVPFEMTVRAPWPATALRLGRFPETNVRTYVHDGAGRSGVWFFSLDAASLAAVATARCAYRLPYYWSSMAVRQDGDRVTYRSRRRLPGPKGPGLRLTLLVQHDACAARLSELDHFLTARWRLFSVGGKGRLRYAHVQHPPWELRPAVVRDLDEDLVTAAGLPPPVGEPLVHYSHGLDAVVSRSWPV